MLYALQGISVVEEELLQTACVQQDGIALLEHQLHSLWSMAHLMEASITLAIAVESVQVVNVLQENTALRAHRDHCHVQAECSVVDLDLRHPLVCVSRDISVNQEPLFPTLLMALLVIPALRVITVKWGRQIQHLAQEELTPMLLVEIHLVIVLSAPQPATVQKRV